MNMINVTKMTFVFFGILFSAIIFSYVDSTVLKVLLLTAIFFYLHSWMISNDTSNSGLKKLNKKNCIFDKSISTKSNCNKSTCTTTDKCGEYVYDRNGKKRYICTSVNYFHDSNNNLIDTQTCSNNTENNNNTCNNTDNNQEEHVNTSSSSEDDTKSDISGDVSNTSTSDCDSITSTVIDESGSDSCNTSLADNVQDNEDNITEKKEDKKEDEKENKKEKILNESAVSEESLFELFDQ